MYQTSLYVIWSGSTSGSIQRVPLAPPSPPFSLRHREREAEKKVWRQSWHSKCTLHSRSVWCTKLILKPSKYYQEGEGVCWRLLVASIWQLNRFFQFLAMFPSPSTSTPFSVKDILNLEQSHDIMVSSLDVSSRMDCCTVSTSSTSSCMLARLKQEPLRDMSSAASLFSEDLHESKAGRGNALNFATAFYGKSLIEMDIVKDGKADSFEGKRRKGEFWFYFEGLWQIRPTEANVLWIVQNATDTKKQTN